MLQPQDTAQSWLWGGVVTVVLVVGFTSLVVHQPHLWWMRFKYKNTARAVKAVSVCAGLTYWLMIITNKCFHGEKKELSYRASHDLGSDLNSEINLLNTFWVRSCSRCFVCIASFNSHSTLWDGYYHPRLINEESAHHRG